ncbi:hypothetical protein HPB48_018923 [Haemaphysalis longicornis]|uniref:Reverse transcriptase domain-containing protein n=1 Tax=Haemaphysalis longicornis TaxID=44386 RepID=A0A9J6GGM4_HAELO|nr:hypothetical protein HPB48_018923 [Haemaphysalis longicornis]
MSLICLFDFEATGLEYLRTLKRLFYKYPWLKRTDAFLFLWYEEGGSSNVEELRMMRVPFGASSSPFLLAATLRHHFQQVRGAYPELADQLKNHCYFDDLVIGATSYEEVHEWWKDLSGYWRRWECA